jgi:hypothetical protein
MMVEPDHVEGIVDYDAVNSPMLVRGQTELPARVGSEVIVKMCKTLRPRRPVPLV